MYPGGLPDSIAPGNLHLEAERFIIVDVSIDKSSNCSKPNIDGRRWTPIKEPIKEPCTNRDQLFYRLHVLAKEIGQAFATSVSTSCTKSELLLFLHRHQELSQLELQGLLGLDAAAITRHLQNLRAQSLITTRKNPADKRITLVALTDAGEAELEQLELRKAAFLQKMTADFTDEEVRMLTQYIERISKNIQL